MASDFCCSLGHCFLLLSLDLSLSLSSLVTDGVLARHGIASFAASPPWNSEARIILVGQKEETVATDRDLVDQEELKDQKLGVEEGSLK